MNDRYITRGVSEQIPLTLQIFMWDCVDRISVEKDYLQVFRLSVKNDKQRIIHEQEQPPLMTEYLLFVSKPINTKVYIIDSGKYSTMLLAEEY